LAVDFHAYDHAPFVHKTEANRAWSRLRSCAFLLFFKLVHSVIRLC
jgi:hypothetical protein